ncbi:MAG: SDR family NAD(P)-dependent oxidoreductase [Opitutales bacterium]
MMASRKAKEDLAIVTGASRGLGRAIASHLLEAGWRVLGVSRAPAAAEPLPGVSWLKLDLADRAQLEAALAFEGGPWSEVGLLVNNAGWADFGPAETTPPESLDGQLETLLRAPMRLSQAVLPGMRRRGRGVIVNVSSLAVEWPIPFLAAYNTAKAGLSAFSRSLELELAGSGVEVIDFRPGDYRTAFYEAARRFGGEAPVLEAAWATMGRRVAASPLPERAASDLGRALARGQTGPIRSGTWFQAHFASFAARCLPSSASAFWIRRYYGMGGL